MSKRAPTPPRHYLKQEYPVRLWPDGPHFSLYYDYDQVRDSKLSGLTADQKRIWFQRRLDMTYLQPLSAIWTPGSPVFTVLFDNYKPCSFSIAAMSSMLNGVEMLGYLIDPPASQKDKKSRKRFLAFISAYMPEWN